MPERSHDPAVKASALRPLLDADAPRAAPGATAILLVSPSSTSCSHCRLPAFAEYDAHTLLAGYGKFGRLGCGARFTEIGATYPMDDDWRRALTQMRPDLPLVD